MSSFARLVVPVDFTEVTESVIDGAQKHAAGDAELFLLHVLPPIGPTAWNLVAAAAKQKESQERAEERLRELAGDDTRIRPIIRMGDPAEEITQLAREIDTEVIVLPAHSRPLLEEWLLGSVTHHVLRLARCPVLVLPERGERAKDDANAEESAPAD